MKTVLSLCNGLGAVASDGTTTNPVTVTIGGVNARVNYSGLAPGYPDLYQVNVVVPEGVAAGNEVSLKIAGQTSPPVSMAVQ